MIEIDVVGARRSGFQSYGLADDKGDSLGFRLLDYLGRGRPAICRVQHLVRLCIAQHKDTYVVFAVMLRSGCEGAYSLGLLILDTT